MRVPSARLASRSSVIITVSDATVRDSTLVARHSRYTDSEHESRDRRHNKYPQTQCNRAGHRSGIGDRAQQCSVSLDLVCTPPAPSQPSFPALRRALVASCQPFALTQGGEGGEEQRQDTEQSPQKIWIPSEDLDPKCGCTGTNDHVWRLAFIWNPNLEDVFRFRNREQKRQITSTMVQCTSL